MWLCLEAGLWGTYAFSVEINFRNLLHLKEWKSLQTKFKQRPTHALIIALALLLAVSGAFLAGSGLTGHFVSTPLSPAVIESNAAAAEQAANSVQTPTVQKLSTSSSVIDSASGEAVTLKLYRNKTQDSAEFQVNNMFPGDSETKSFVVEVSYTGNVTLYFHADIQSGSEKLAEVLKCKVALKNGTVLYDGLMKDMPKSISYELPKGSGSTATITYDITAYLDTSVGNEYMEKELRADFRWWVNADSQLVPPKTGDEAHFCVWFWIAMLSLLLNIALLATKLRRKNDYQEEDA